VQDNFFKVFSIASSVQDNFFWFFEGLLKALEASTQRCAKGPIDQYSDTDPIL